MLHSCFPSIVSYTFTFPSCLSPCPLHSTESEVFSLQPLIQIWSLFEYMHIHRCSPHSLVQVPGHKSWLENFIIPIHKCSYNLDNLSNYLPISLLHIFSKLLVEKHVHSLLYKLCFEHNFTSTTYFGFLLHRSISLSLLFANRSFHSLLKSNKLVNDLFPRSLEGLWLRSSQTIYWHAFFLNLPPYLNNW